MAIFILIVIFAAVLWYAIWGRVWLKTKPWAAGFFAWIEPIEIKLYKKSETILWARIKMLTGAILTFLTSLGQIDITPLMPFVPDQYEGMFKAVFNLIPMVITIVGMIDEKQRNSTTLPIQVVAAPAKDITPVAAEAIAATGAAVAEAKAV